MFEKTCSKKFRNENKKIRKNFLAAREQKSTPWGAFFRGSAGGSILYLILCEQQEDEKIAFSPSGINQKTDFNFDIKWYKKTPFYVIINLPITLTIE